MGLLKKLKKVVKKGLDATVKVATVGLVDGTSDLANKVSLGAYDKAKKTLFPKAGNGGYDAAAYRSLLDIGRIPSRQVYEAGAGARDARRAYIGDIARGREGEIRAAMSRGYGDVRGAEQAPAATANANVVSGDDLLQSRLARARGLTKVALGTTSAAGTQLTNERLAAVGAGAARRRAALAGLRQRVEAEVGHYDSKTAADIIKDRANSDLWGSIAGMGLSGAAWGLDRYRNKQTEALLNNTANDFVARGGLSGVL